ncbi:MAG: TonB-dependent receptor plug domain-containing protein [Pseudomonadota bacterium]
MTGTASAQQADGSVLLDRIIFGFGTPRVALDTPQAVTSLDQDDIDRQQATTPAELLDDVPGVQPIGSNRAAGISFNIRGIGELAASDESKIVVTVDGATKFHEQYRVGSFFGDPELYKRVEVLRGPASSTLVGAGALGLGT